MKDTRLNELKRIFKVLENEDLTDSQRDALEERRDYLRDQLNKEGIDFEEEV